VKSKGAKVKPKPRGSGGAGGKVLVLTLVLAVRCCDGTLGDERMLGELKAEVE
jgi:hypothetical protein